MATTQPTDGHCQWAALIRKLGYLPLETDLQWLPEAPPAQIRRFDLHQERPSPTGLSRRIRLLRETGSPFIYLRLFVVILAGGYSSKSLALSYILLPNEVYTLCLHPHCSWVRGLSVLRREEPGPRPASANMSLEASPGCALRTATKRDWSSCPKTRMRERNNSARGR